MITIEQQRAEMRQEISDEVDNLTLDKFLRRAKNKYLSLVFPYNREIIELPDDRAREWQTRCAIELYNLDGNENITSYSENGLSESYGRAGISQDLLNELPPPQAGVIK